MQRWWFWAMYIDPVFWSINGLVGTQLGDVQETMTLQNGGTTQVRRNTTMCHALTPRCPKRRAQYGGNLLILGEQVV